MIPAASSTAYDRLVAEGQFDIRTQLEAHGLFGDAAFVVRFDLPPSNGAGLPAVVDVRAVVPAQFPFGKVEFTPVGDEVRGFPHQDGRTGALCLKPSRAYPFDPAERLHAYVESAQEWLEDAANDTLLIPGQPWELPDFRVDRNDLPPPLYILESPASFPYWKVRIGQFGSVQLAGYRHGRGLVPVRFSGANDPAFEPEVSDGFLQRKVAVMGTWVLLPSHLAWRHRPSRNFEDLEGLCRAAGVDLWTPLRRALKAKPCEGFHYLLVGAPIPRIVGEEPSEVHWQPIAFPQQRSGPFVPGTRPKSRTSADQRSFRARMRGSLLHQAIPWATVQNVAPDRLAKRGALHGGMRETRICLLGCGAVGSVFSEYIVRGAARDLALFDCETLDLENLSRHTLAGPEVGRSKAVDLARRLNGIHPLATVRGFLSSLPLLDRPPRREREAREAFDGADAYIECTANESVFQWLSRVGRERGQLVLHVFLGADARFLTICASGRHASCATVARKLFADIYDGRTPFTWDEYDPRTEEVMPGAGCWQGTFPAKGWDIAALVACAMPIVEHLLSHKWPSRGVAVVLQRHELVTSPDGEADLAGRSPLVDVAWRESYR